MGFCLNGDKKCKSKTETWGMYEEAGYDMDRLDSAVVSVGTNVNLILSDETTIETFMQNLDPYSQIPFPMIET